MTGGTLRRLQELAAGLPESLAHVGERRRGRIWRAACQSAIEHSAFDDSCHIQAKARLNRLQ